MKRPTNRNSRINRLSVRKPRGRNVPVKTPAEKTYKIDLLNSSEEPEEVTASSSRRQFLKSTSGLTLASAFGLGLVASRQQALAQTSGTTEEYDEYIKITLTKDVTATSYPPSNGSVSSITTWVHGYDAGATVTVEKGTYNPNKQKIVPVPDVKVSPSPTGLLNNKFTGGVEYRAKINKAVKK